ncbi:spore germination lipoprotein GerD [Neobacillus mesonae]|uniref:spore germination lipoprotein GerD n=1 Tax=Neobacillus mesonae TaxID=1193713 RepID=UPI0020412409|nr:spore germination lipoprotein GerD [Neobacillus mesonae]MCM3570111.1 spore germination lipoprotein GerD [Neobacillus mesonae]
MRVKSILLLLPIMMILTSCSSNDTSGGGQIDYDQTKKMVVDILKTDEGKKAIKDLMDDDSMKHSLVMDQKVITDTIQQTLTSDKAAQFWKKTYSDPKFAQGVAKHLKAENEKLLKDLMNDPDYRNMMIQVFKEPEIQKEMTDAMKSKEYRDHIKKVIQETMDSPLFKVKMQEFLLKAAEDAKAKADANSDKNNAGQSSNETGGES